LGEGPPTPPFKTPAPLPFPRERAPLPRQRFIRFSPRACRKETVENYIVLRCVFLRKSLLSFCPEREMSADRFYMLSPI